LRIVQSEQAGDVAFLDGFCVTGGPPYARTRSPRFARPPRSQGGVGIALWVSPPAPPGARCPAHDQRLGLVGTAGQPLLHLPLHPFGTRRPRRGYKDEELRFAQDLPDPSVRPESFPGSIYRGRFATRGAGRTVSQSAVRWIAAPPLCRCPPRD